MAPRHSAAMKLLPAVLFLLATPAAAQLGATNYAVDAPLKRPADARLVWHDEFNGRAIDPYKWSFETARNKQGWPNHERQYYSDRPDNARIEQGHLVIESRRDGPAIKGRADWGGQDYSSAKLTTAGHRSWTYGFYEVRAKLPCARGLWPAIWMLPDVGKWPDGGEIDIMEQVGWQPDTVHATLHTALFTHTKGTQRGGSITLTDDCTQFHRYQLDWQVDAIIIGVDDRAYMRVRNDQPGGRGAWPFDAPFHLILNVAVGGDWGGQQGIDDTAFPRSMQVDYVRVWQRPSKR